MIGRIFDGAGPRMLAARLVRFRSAPGGLILAYHNIVPTGALPLGDRSLHLPVERFRSHLDVLAAAAEVVEVDELRRNPRSERGRPRVAITFDDAYRGALTLGLEELRHRGWPATVFVAPGILGSPGMWWDVLSTSGGGLPPAVRDHALWRLAGQDAVVREMTQHAETNEPTLPPAFGIVTEIELLAAARQDGVTLAAHSWSHANLAALPAADLAYELAAPLTWLQERGPRALPWLAYPYGLYSDEVERAVSRAGYEAALTVTRGWVGTEDMGRYRVPRLNVAAGVLGLRLAVHLAFDR